MDTIKCSYCDCKVRVADVEADDGACPECGAPLMASFLFDEERVDMAGYAEGVTEEDDDLDFEGGDDAGAGSVRAAE